MTQLNPPGRVGTSFSALGRTMRTQLTVANLATIKAPIVRCTTRFLTGTGQYRSLRPSGRMDSLPRGLRPMGTGAVVLGDYNSGKQHAFQMAGDEYVFMEFGFAKSGGGFKPMSKMMYLRAGMGLPQATLEVRIGAVSVTVLSGPMEIMTTHEAREIFGHLHNEAVELDLTRSARDTGLTFHSEGARVRVRRVETLDVHGLPTDVAVRRRKRILDL